MAEKRLRLNFDVLHTIIWHYYFVLIYLPLSLSLSGSPFLFSFILLHFSLTIQCSLGSSFVIQTIAMQLLNHIIEVEEVSARMLERGREKKIREKLRAPVGSGGGISSSHYNHL